MRTVYKQDLSPLHCKLLKAAERAAEVAHCNYSHYPVGAALLIRSGSEETIVTGNNYETLTYRSVCAEKHALMRAYAQHSVTREDGTIERPKVLAVAVYCARGAAPQQPCGDCRQALHEINADMQVVAQAGPGKDDGPYDPRVTITTVRALLPHGFAIESLRGEINGLHLAIAEETDPADFVVHLPRPDALTTDAAHRTALLQNVDHMILVGSPRRARRIAEMAHKELGAPPPEETCYCDLTVPGRDESGREYAVYAFRAGKAKVAVVSHGIGKAGVEIVMSEVPALIHLAQGAPAKIAGALRCGTRGTLAQLPLGCIALSTSTVNEHLDRMDPDPMWVERLREAGRRLGMTPVSDSEIDTVGRDHPDPSTLLTEGTGLSASFFWQGQGRPMYTPTQDGTGVRAIAQKSRAAMLGSWVQANVRYIEMEDYTVHRIGAQVNIPTATLGAVIAHRRRADGTFQLDYSKGALQRSELVPARIALHAIAGGNQ